MLQAKARRGRPKGTGIDDNDRIARLAELIKVHPELKPTTAIRKMGISDPSVIRRLRDKYHAFTKTDEGHAAGLARPISSTVPAATAESAPATPATRH